MICPYFPTPYLFFVTSEISPLVYYSHFSSILIALLVGTFVFLNNPSKLPNKLLFFVTSLFSLWVLSSLTQWTNNDSSIIAFSWSQTGLLYASLNILTLHFFLSFMRDGIDVPVSFKIVWMLLLLPVLLLSNTTFNVQYFDLIECGAGENILFAYYYYGIGLVALIWTILAGIHYLKVEKRPEQKKVKFIALLGTALFLFIFFANGLVASYLFENGYVSDFSIEQYGLFGMTFFMVTLSYLIVKFKAFDIKLVGAQALVIALWVLIASLLFVEKEVLPRIISLITLIFVTISGALLIRSVKKEIKQKEEMEKLAKQLEVSNMRLRAIDKAKSEFVSIASHQLRSPLTAIRGYASLLVEGSYGELPEKMKEPARRIEASANLMAMSIEDYLNISRIESGNMKYNLSDFNLYEMADKLCDDLRPEALKKGLILLFRSDLSSVGMVHADIGKTYQILHNLINNSIKYTPKGSISIFMRDDVTKKKIYVDIIDTGIGMSPETISKLFNKFARASDANIVNVTGTGLGLFVALKMAEAMGGNVTCHSDGEGKGSTFTFELPLKI